MATLIIDTSARIGVGVVERGGDVRATRAREEHRQHAELVAPTIREVLADAGLTTADLDAVVVGTGPAPYTGLRVGIVSGEVMALSLGLPCYGVCSLDAIAATTAVDLACDPGTTIVVATDARRREVYVRHYRVVDASSDDGNSANVRTIEAISDPEVLDPTAAAEQIPHGAIIAGEGAVLYPEALPLTDGAAVVVDPGALGRLALRRRVAGDLMPATPLYLRRPDITMPTQRKRVTT